MNDLFHKITKHFGENNSKKIEDIYKKLLPYYDENDLFSSSFACAIADYIIDDRLDLDSVISALVYPAYKINPSVLNESFISEEVLSIFSRLTKIENLDMATHKEQLDNIKSMFIALAKDIRVVIIKICIEASKLKFLDKFSDSEVSKFMQEVNDVYFPIAQMIGLSQIKNAFGNATFKYYKPYMYKELSDTLSKYVEDRNASIKHVINKLKEEMASICPNLVVYGRQKQLYSIAKKLQSKNMGISSINDIYGRNNYLNEVAENVVFSQNKLNQIIDILAVRVLVDTVEECYSVLGKVFTLFQPLGNFKDYIANPKENGYQSLHTAIVLENGDPVEIQIRTYDMHTYAEYGFAAHWAYKDKKKVDESGVKINYIRSIMDLHKDKSSEELLDAMKTDVYSGKIFVQSPMGKIISFPEGATPIDFAYSIHSNIGNTCVGAKINNRMVPLNTPMNNGDVIEIITNPNANGPSRDWLKIVKSSSAKSKINAFFKKEMKEDNIKKGKSILENHDKTRKISLSNYLKDDYLYDLFDKYSFQNIDDMYASIGYGGVTANQIVNKLIALEQENTSVNLPQSFSENNTPNKSIHGEVLVKGFSDLYTKFARCCNPIPGDQIIGYISRGNGITIHRQDCEALSNYEFDRLIECDWCESSTKDFTGSFSILAEDTNGLIGKITKIINDDKITIIGLNAKKLPNNKANISLNVNVKDKLELDSLINKLSQIDFIIEVYR